jgi:hypothetical protein
VDLALVYRPEKDNNLEYGELFKDEMVLLMSSRDPLTQYPVILPDHFSDQVLITHSAKGKQGLIFKDVLSPAGVEVRKIVYVQLTEAVVEMEEQELNCRPAKMGVKTILVKWKSCNQKITNRGLFRKWSAATLKTTRRFIIFNSSHNY